MARNISDINKRDGEILLAALTLVKNNGGEMKYSAIKEELPKVFSFSSSECRPTKTREHGWYACLSMVGGIELKAAGLIDSKKGVWYLTKEGEKSLSLSPEEFYKLYHYRWLDIQKAKRALNKDTKQVKEEPILEKELEFNIDILKDKARDQIRQYITKKDPYEFQFMVAALLRSMGYFTPFIAPKGRDGGIDIIAYCDELGITKPIIKVQIKHYPNNPISVDVIRSLTGICKQSDEIGIVITSGSFTNEAHRESRSLHSNIRLIDGEEFIDLWIANYSNMPEEDKALLPITPVYYLNLQ